MAAEDRWIRLAQNYDMTETLSDFGGEISQIPWTVECRPSVIAQSTSNGGRVSSWPRCLPRKACTPLEEGGPGRAKRFDRSTARGAV